MRSQPSFQSCRLSPDQMVAAVDSCRPLAHALARRFHRTNPIIPLAELRAAALSALKLAALKFEPARGRKFITPAYRYVYVALIDFCRVESARGMHVPTDHPPYYAPAPRHIDKHWHHPDAAACLAVNDLGDDFWRSVARTLPPREASLVLGVFREGRHQKDVAEELGISKARAGQLFCRAMAKLRKRDDLRELARAA